MEETVSTIGDSLITIYSPGQMIRIGGSCFSITRVCTEEVCVRSNTSGLCWIKNVSCISRAGWSSAKFKEEKTCQSSSISGPSAMLNPNRPNISQILSLQVIEDDECLVRSGSRTSQIDIIVCGLYILKAFF